MIKKVISRFLDKAQVTFKAKTIKTELSDTINMSKFKNITSLLQRKDTFVVYRL